MNEQSIRALHDALNPLAQKLGEGAAQLYAIYVRMSGSPIDQCAAYTISAYGTLYAVHVSRGVIPGIPGPWQEEVRGIGSARG